MPKKAHTEEQIVAVLRQGEAGEKVAEICRKVGISEGTYYAWKKQYAGLGISELRELRQLREENGTFETASGGSQPGSADPAGDCVKKALKPGLRRKLGQWAQQTYQIGQRRVARLMKIGWSTWMYKKKVRRFDAGVTTALVRDGRKPRALGVSTFDRVVASGRLDRERETHLPAVHGGAVDCAHQAAAEDRPPSAWRHSDRDGAEPVLEHGFYERQVRRWPFVPHSDSSGPVHAGVRLLGSRSCHDGDESSAGAGASESRARTSAGQHYSGQWQRVQQSCSGSLGHEQ
jgi:putative transposase